MLLAGACSITQFWTAGQWRRICLPQFKSGHFFMHNYLIKAKEVEDWIRILSSDRVSFTFPISSTILVAFAINTKCPTKHIAPNNSSCKDGFWSMERVLINLADVQNYSDVRFGIFGVFRVFQSRHIYEAASCNYLLRQYLPLDDWIQPASPTLIQLLPIDPGCPLYPQCWLFPIPIPRPCSSCKLDGEKNLNTVIISANLTQ